MLRLACSVITSASVWLVVGLSCGGSSLTAGRSEGINWGKADRGNAELPRRRPGYEEKAVFSDLILGAVLSTDPTGPRAEPARLWAERGRRGGCQLPVISLVSSRTPEMLYHFPTLAPLQLHSLCLGSPLSSFLLAQFLPILQDCLTCGEAPSL